jgi:hypothetical protein
MHGREMPGPNDRMLEAYIRDKKKQSNVHGAVKELAKTLKEARKVAWNNIKRGKEIQKRYHDRKANPVEFQEGQLVYRKEMVKKGKLKGKWKGPYNVLKKISEHAYRIEGRNGKPVMVNVEQLKLCRSTKEQIREQKRFRKYHRLMDNDNGHLEQSDSGGDSTEPEGYFQNLGVEPCTLMEGVTLGEKQEECTGRELNSELSNMNDRPSQSDDTGTGGPEEETETSGIKESQYYFFRPRRNISYKY